MDARIEELRRKRLAAEGQPQPDRALEVLRAKRLGMGAMEAVDSSGRAFARGVPVIGGAMDEIAAGINTGAGLWGDYGQELEEQRRTDARFDEAHPYLSTALQVTGGIAGLGAGMKTLGVPPVPSTLSGKMAAGAVEGGTLGGIEAFTRGDGDWSSRMSDALKGGAVGTAFGAIMPLMGHLAGRAYEGGSDLVKKGVDAVRGTKAPTPTADQLKRVGRQLYQQADDLGVAISPEAYDNIIDGIHRSIAESGGYIPENSPQLHNALKFAEQYRGSAVPLSTVEDVYRQIRDSAGANVTNKQMGRQVGYAVKGLWNSVDAIPDEQIIGNAADKSAAIGLTKQAREMWSRFRKTELLDDIMSNAENAQGANYSNAKFLTSVRQQLRGIAKDSFARAPWLSQTDKKLILDSIRGGDVENFARAWGKFSAAKPSGLAMSAIVGGGVGGAAAGLGPAAALPAGAAMVGLSGGGYVADKVAEALQGKGLEALRRSFTLGEKPIQHYTAQELAAIMKMLTPVTAQQAGEHGPEIIGKGY